MKLQEDQQRLKGLLQETITLLCKNGLNYSAEFSVEALIVITLDQDKIFHTSIKETVAKESTVTDDEDSSPEVKSPVKSKKPLKRSHNDRPGNVSPKKGRRSMQDSMNSKIHLKEDQKSSLQTIAKYEDDTESENSSEILLIKEEKADDYENYGSNSMFNSTSVLSGKHISEAEFCGSVSVNSTIGQVVQSGYSEWTIKNPTNDGSFLNMSEQSINSDASQVSIFRSK